MFLWFRVWKCLQFLSFEFNFNFWGTWGFGGEGGGGGGMLNNVGWMQVKVDHKTTLKYIIQSTFPCIFWNLVLGKDIS